MALDNLPAVQSIIEQTGLLERAFYDPIDANLAYGRLADEEMFPNGIGETLTKSRPALYPLALSLSPITPSSNTGYDNGLTDQYYTFEQFQLSIGEYANTTTVNVLQDRTLIQKIFLQNYMQLGEHAGRTLDGLASQFVHQAYDSGNTFCTTAVSAGQTTIHVDNAKGFDTTFSSTNSPGLPGATSSGNPASVSIYNGTTGALKGTVSVTSVALDVTNTSTAFVNGIAYGASGTLTLSGAYAGTAAVAGDTVVASDGAYIVRPGTVPNTNRNQLAASQTLSLVTLANAVAKLKARNVPPLPNGNYLCIIDPTIWPQLLSDSAFQYSTMGALRESDGSGYFKNSMVNRTLGLEFVNSNLVPRFNTASSTGNNANAVYARHAVVGGMGLLIKGTFQGSLDAARQAQGMQNSDIKFIEKAKISLITRAPLDRLQEFIMQSWRWVGGFVAPTDVTSTPLIIPTTDYARYKRCVVIEVASAS